MYRGVIETPLFGQKWAYSARYFYTKPLLGSTSLDPGSPVTGILKYAVDENTNLNAIFLSLRGKVICDWSEGNSGQTSYRGVEKVCHNEINILPPGGVTVKKMREYECPFRFVLPENCPPSFKDRVASITYSIKVKFDRSGVFSSTKKFYTEIMVRNHVSSLQPPMSLYFDLEKKISKLFSADFGTMSVNLQMEKNVLFAGEKASLNFFVKNQSKVKILGIKAEFVVTKKYTSQTKHTMTRKQSLAEITTASVDKNSVQTFLISLQTPKDAYTIRNSKYFSQEYKLKVTIKLPTFYQNESMHIPVVFETPSRYYVFSDMSNRTNCSQRGEDPPPSYWEVMAESKS